MHRWLLAVLFFFASVAWGAAAFRQVTAIELDGAVRTNPKWLQEYLDIEFPALLGSDDLDEFKQKLLTTGVYREVSLEFRPIAGSENSTLVIHLDEKWTTIPVVRGAYGGGTPLKVAGIYDTHVWGSLWTLGTEARQYGNAPPGFVSWARAPRWLTGKHVISIELWREFRERSLYNSAGDLQGVIRNDMTMERMLYLAPIGSHGHRTRSGEFRSFWQAGLDARAKSLGQPGFSPAEGVNEADVHGIDFGAKANGEVQILPTLVFDDVTIDNIELNGTRWTSYAGPTVGLVKPAGRFETEINEFALPAEHWNLCAHGFLGAVSSEQPAEMFYLGGFDSIRGFPDGIIFGSHAYYYNFEARHLSVQLHDVWLQTAAFLDGGSAASDFNDLGSGFHASMGAGLRIAIPQVYRLMLRIDYAWALTSPHSQGITAGLNQFFDPYKPL